MTAIRVKIIGAGSIGNHLAHAARRMGWHVTVMDSDPKALRRMKEEIYPKRYGCWDESIECFDSDSKPKGGFDVICVGTPPDVRLKVAAAALDEKPRILQLEKPLASPLINSSLQDFVEAVQKSGVIVCAGYDYAVSEITQFADEILKSAQLGEPETLDAEFRVHWGDIFAAHPWLKGPQDSYLGYWTRGGGASGEHSHAANLWQHFSHTLGQGRVKEVSAILKYVRDGTVNYDKLCLMNLVTETGFTGRVVQDVVTTPHQQMVRFQGSKGFLESYIRWNQEGDMVRWGEKGGEVRQKFMPKKRLDDFYQEMLHIQDLLEGRVSPKESPISFERGLDTLLVIAAAHLSTRTQKTVRLQYDRPYGPASMYTVY